jgi:ATP-dependent helicase HrpB
MDPLPIDPSLPEVVSALRAASAVVIEAPPGAGKTTRVPRALLDAGFGEAGEILVVQPRRLPARLAAERVARELGQAPGQTVGYSVRFEEVSGPRTRVRYLTEGILSRRLLADPRLRGVGTVVLDEFHERHVATDLALALLRSLQAGARPDLKLCVMSATLDAAPVGEYLGGCPRVRSEGRAFEVALEFLPEPDDRPLPVQVASAVRRLVRDGPPGDLLVFLPGAGEIRRAQEALAPLVGPLDLAVLPLHGEMPLAEQDRAVRPAPGGRRKVILSTNVAETSVTIDGVVVVIDSGLARVAATSPWSGLPRLSLAKISQASAIQRAGRAGRTRPGRALRLYTRHDFDLRRRYDLPEIARTDLCETVLALHAAGVSDPAGFPWFEAPPAAALQAAQELLARLGAVEGEAGAARLSELGRRMLSFPVHPRLARLICEGERRGAAEGACLAAALIAERDIRERSRASFGGGAAGGGGNGRSGTTGGRSGAGGGDGRGADLLDLIDLFRQAAAANFSRERLRGLGLDPRAVEMVDRARRQLASISRPSAPRAGGIEDEERALRLATLTGFPDRVGRRREQGRGVVLSGGGSADLDLEWSAPGAGGVDLLVAVDVEERARAGGAGAHHSAGSMPAAGATIRLAAAIEPEWLLDLYADRLRQTDQLAWNPTTERVERASRLSYGAVVLEESLAAAPPSPEASRMLAEAAAAHGLERFDPPGALAEQLARIAFARELSPDGPLPPTELGPVMAAACAGLTRFAELREGGVVARVLQSLTPEAGRLLRALAPESLALPGGRQIPIHYEVGKPPWIESRLQDFFGMARGPRIGGDRIALTIHLLAPNGRPVQVTSDLASFWQQHYPPLRRELGRRYPKHAWPEDGRTARPPPPRPPRPGGPSRPR